MNYKIFLLLPLMAAGLASCHDDLEETVFSNLTDETAFTSAENAQAAVNAMYAPLHQIYRDPMFQASDGTTDVCYDAGVKAFEVLNDNEIWVSSHMATCWDNFFQVTSRANIVIDRVGAMEESIFGDEYDKGQMLAQAHFMRAYGYMELSDLFYRVPLTLSSGVDVDAKLPLASVEEIDEAIEKDLLAAMTLPESYSSLEDANRPTLGAARGFLVRLYMRQAGRMRQAGQDATAKWKQALEVVNEVLKMEGSTYSLQPNIWDVFNPETDATLYNNELMFAIRASENISSGSWDLGLMFTNWDYDMGWNLFLVPLHQYWSFEPGDTRGSEMLVTEFPNVYNGDNGAANSYYIAPKSLAEISKISRSGLDESGALKPGETYGTIGELSNVFTRKYEYHNSFKYTYRTKNNMPVLRFADMILCKAEILNEINGPTQDAINLINRIRSRAFGDDNHGLKLADYSTKEALRSAICDERAKELGMECVRRVDLIRMGLWKDRMQKYFDQIKAIAQARATNEGKPAGYYDDDWRVYPQDLTDNDKRRYMPIPKRETDYNPEFLNARNF